ncbi:T9SS type A sorting domain-containing protein [Aquimarina sp. ERC-38]|uniref:T9SS type A sorting domain-containing protein n=1 Tax=Aquimarina sp. ERC-38 TaxID=2949996 RepID=UPI0022466424|nr:T9SS type A sorting domain-containing protein [Aquimarina sp. ERC-38]UZO81214.1 T9SS type A sorting domain-containing protein [Aquimarina sp. ERC-38]
MKIFTLRQCLLLFLTLVCTSFLGRAQFEKLIPNNTVTHKAEKSGNWNDPTIWSSKKVPTTSSIVLIPKGTTVNYNVYSDAHIFAIRNDGTLHFFSPKRKKRKLIVDTFVNSADSYLNINAGQNSNGTIEIILKAFDIERKKKGQIGGFPWNNRAKAHYSDGKRVTDHFGKRFPNDGPGVLGRYGWDPRQASITLMTWGKVRINGINKLDFSECSKDVLKNQRKITLKKNPWGWRVGDSIVLGGTKGRENETFAIKSISGRIVEVDRNIKYDHKGMTLDGKRYFTYTANLTRNIVVRSAFTGIEENLTRRGHVMFMFNGDVDVKNALFKDLGRTDKSNILDDFKLGVPVLSGTGNNADIDFPNMVEGKMEDNPSKIENQRGRYALHFHKSLRGKNKGRLIQATGNVVWGSPGWGMVHHDSHANFSENVVLEISGGSMIAESGSETGIWSNNYVAGGGEKRKKVGPGEITISAQIRRTTRSVLDDDFRGSAGYGLQGRAVEMVNNVASSVGVAYHYQGSGENTIVADKVDTSVFAANGKVNPFPFTKDVVRTAVPLIRFDGNRAFNCGDGFKSQGRVTGAFNRVLSVVSNMVVWNSNRFGAYISSNFGYLVKDSKFHGMRGSSQSTGVLTQTNSDNINFNNVTFYNYERVGVNVNAKPNFSQNNENARFIYNNVKWKDSPRNFKPYKDNTSNQIVVKNMKVDPRAKVTFKKSSNMDDEVDVNRDFKFTIRGTVTDQAGSTQFAHYTPKLEPTLQRTYNFGNASRLRREFLNGRTLRTDKRGKYVVFNEFMSDRLTGRPTAVPLKIYVKGYNPTNRSATPEDAISIYPNPTNELINITGVFNNEVIKIYDVLGVLKREILSNQETMSININDLPSGVYFVSVKSEDNKGITRKIIKN